MNKIVVDKEKLTVTDVASNLDIKPCNLTIDCFGKNLLIIKNKNNLNLNIIMEDNSFLDILIYNMDKLGNNKVVITQNNNTTINYYEAFQSKDLTSEDITNVLLGNNNQSNLKIRCISKNKNIKINVLAEALKNTKNNEITEDVKGINDGGKITIQPNMEINTQEIMANHFVTIGGISKDNLFYFQSKGISLPKAKELILEGFLKGIFTEYQDILWGGEKNE